MPVIHFGPFGTHLDIQHNKDLVEPTPPPIQSNTESLDAFLEHLLGKGYFFF